MLFDWNCISAFLQVKGGQSVNEAGSDNLSFETFDAVTQRVKDALSISDHLYCPEGHAPSTRTGVRFICNSSTLAPDLLAYLDRAPKKKKPVSLPITVYVLENSPEEFSGYAIEIVEEEDDEGEPLGPKSVASVVVASKKPSIETIASAIELSAAGLAADAEEAAAAEDDSANDK